MNQDVILFNCIYNIRMSSNLPNPFVVGTPVLPERFVGRKSFISAAFDSIHNRSHLAVWGGLGMGKTSLLKKIACPHTWSERKNVDLSSAVIVYFSCEEIEPFTSSSFWEKIITSLNRQLQSEPELQAKINILLTDGKASRDSLRQILRELRHKTKFLVLLIDDYDKALFVNPAYSETDMQQFLSEFRNLAVYSEGTQNISIIVTSKKRLNDLGPRPNPNQSPWYNHYLFRQLKPFDYTETQQLLQPFKISITSELRPLLGEIAGGHPYLLQIACFLLYPELRNPKPLQVEEFIREEFIREFENSTKQFFEYAWLICSKDEQILLMLMALKKLKGRLHKRRQYDLKDVDMIFTQNERCLINLEEQGIIKRITIQNTPSYVFTTSMMEKWVIQETWNSDEKALKERQKEFLNLMSHQQAQNAKNAIVWLGKNKDDVTSALNFMNTVGEKILKLFAA
jgi:hypothetical protein